MTGKMHGSVVQVLLLKTYGLILRTGVGCRSSSSILPFGMWAMSPYVAKKQVLFGLVVCFAVRAFIAFKVVGAAAHVTASKSSEWERGREVLWAIVWVFKTSDWFSFLFLFSFSFSSSISGGAFFFFGLVVGFNMPVQYILLLATSSIMYE